MTNPKVDIDRFLSELMDYLDFSPAEQQQALAKLKASAAVPVRLIGIGQTGVGKTELLRSIFRMSDDQLEALRELRTGSTESTTKGFHTFEIRSPEGLSIEFTDGPGLGEDQDLDESYIAQWVAEIPKHDLLYWVMDAASRDISHIQRNMKRILDETGFRSRFLLVLNKVDNIQLDEIDRDHGARGWNARFNVPTARLEALIARRTADITAKFSRAAAIDPEQIVACSALKRWNHGEVLDRMLALLPPEKRLKAAINRDVKSATELMDPDIRARILEDDDHHH